MPELKFYSSWALLWPIHSWYMLWDMLRTVSNYCVIRTKLGYYRGGFWYPNTIQLQTKTTPRWRRFPLVYVQSSLHTLTFQPNIIYSKVVHDIVFYFECKNVISPRFKGTKLWKLSCNHEAHVRRCKNAQKMRNTDCLDFKLSKCTHSAREARLTPWTFGYGTTMGKRDAHIGDEKVHDVVFCQLRML